MRDSSGSANSITQYVDGVQDGTVNSAGVISAGSVLNEQNAYIGSKILMGTFLKEEWMN